MTPLEATLDRPATSDGARRAAPSTFRVLVADDQTAVLEALRLLLNTNGFDVVTATSPDQALMALHQGNVHAALVDLNYGQGLTTGEQGLALVSAIREADPSLPVVAMTAWSSMDLAIEAMKRGARDFVEKPWDEGRLVSMLRSQAELGLALRKVAALETEVQRLRTTGTVASPSTSEAAAPMAEMRLLDVEGALVRQAMHKFRGNVSRAARALGLSRSALYRRLERHKISLSARE